MTRHIANVTAEAWAAAEADYVGFWENAAHRLDWDEPWISALDWTPPYKDEAGSWHSPVAKWFVGGKINVAVNCVDRHVAAGNGDKVAYHWEAELGDTRTLTYSDLQTEVNRAANALTELGIVQGDRVVLYLPVLPETVIAALALGRIGAILSFVFGGFSAENARFRLQDTGAKMLITTDGRYRRGQAVTVKPTADEACQGLDQIETVLVIKRTGQEVPWTAGRDVWWHDVVPRQSAAHSPQFFDAESPLFIVHTSGTTEQPKGLVHTMGGYLTQAAWTHWEVFDLQPDDVFWCTADFAWITGHSYGIYGPLANGATSVIYEGTPNSPHRARHLEIIERYRVTIYYTAPTLIRTFMSWYGQDLPPGYDVSSLRLLGTVGEAINPAAWKWYRRTFGRGHVPVIDTWWQSETGGHMIAPLPYVTHLQAGSATKGLPGIFPAVVDDKGDPVGPHEHGRLVITRPWPGMARTVWGDPQRYFDTYWKRFRKLGYYLAGDGATVDEDGNIWLQGRMDEVINVSGHRISTVEIESALVTHFVVAEAGVTGIPDDLTGQAIAAFVILIAEESMATDVTGWIALSRKFEDELRNHVAHMIGPVAKPKHVYVVPELPKTRSGKIMRRLLGAMYTDRTLGDTTSLQDQTVVKNIQEILAALPHEHA